jgi:hypothetical protein
MKKLPVAMLTCLLFLMACKKNADQQTTANAAYNTAIHSNGTITGMDSRKCACCWGWLVEINGKEYKFDRIPGASSFDLNNITYPAKVKIEWQDVQGSCNGRLIEVLSISSL